MAARSVSRFGSSVVLAAMLFLPVANTQAGTDIIPSAYTMIAGATGVPPDVLYAVASQESNRKIQGSRYRPWPWTLNVAGKSYYYESKDAACRALHIALAAHDAKRVDVGIAQINLGWNPNAFAWPCQGLDPYLNLRTAGRILRNHYNASGSWAVAAGLYHHPAGGAIAAKYQRSVEQRLKKINQQLQVATSR